MANMSEPPVSLEDLLKLKRHEAPKADFWAGFERDFQKRRLRALMEDDERSARFGFWRQLFLWGPVSGGAVAAIVFLFVSIPHGPGPGGATAGTGNPELASAAVPEPASSQASFVVAGLPESPPARDFVPSVEDGRSRFVFDALASDQDARGFRRILSNAVLSVPATAGSRYVTDPLTTGRADAVSAAYRPRAHF